MIEIKHQDTGETLFTHEGDNLRWANLHGADLSGANLSRANLRGARLSGANLHGADLSGANLSGANLRGANLRWADLSGATGDGEVVRTMQLPRYPVVICDDWLAIGCEAHRVHEWRDFSDERIARMDEGALEWWREWKEVVLAFADCP